jgi:hypothetical protein
MLKLMGLGPLRYINYSYIFFFSMWDITLTCALTKVLYFIYSWGSRILSFAGRRDQG